jgi:8-oxo-dGTP pyrophosphatase MutT (NUDIX family)
MYFNACVLTINHDGAILAISPKDNDFGLPSTRVEPGETPMEAAARELLEKTGYIIADPRYCHMLYHAEVGDELVVTYEVSFDALKKTKNASGIVSWLKPETLTQNKKFGEYNRNLFKTCGIKLANSRSNQYHSYESSYIAKKQELHGG